MALLTVHLLATIFGIASNATSALMFLAPVSTFYTIYKKKSSAGYHALPYAVILANSILFAYYGFVKIAYMMILINVFGVVVEIVYLSIYIIYAPRGKKIFTVMTMILFNIVASASLAAATYFLTEGSKRVAIAGWISAVSNHAVYAAPFSVMMKVIRTKSVEYMPFSLSIVLTLRAITWFLYGFFINDWFVAVPSVSGLLFGIVQIILYITYKDNNKDVELTKQKKQEGNQSMKQSSSHILKLCPSDDHPTESNENNDAVQGPRVWV